MSEFTNQPTPLGIDAAPGDLPLARSRQLQRRAHELIPGGCHTYAKGDDQFPLLAPGFIARGCGAHVWDLDGNQYIEYGMGLRAVTLGHGHPRVIEAVARHLPHGTNFGRPSPLELECAEEFLRIIDSADMVKFTKDGSSATSAALKLARAYTGRDKVALCADHPFFSVDDWFIGTTPVDAGIPQCVKDLTLTFHYNNPASLERLFAEHPGKIACVILEAAKYDDPADGFLHKVQDICRRHGAVFVLDEMITGFRWHLRGAQRYYNVTPDLSAFGKGMANGFSVSALCGKREIIELGGLHHDRPRVFLLSTTHGAETHSLAAAIETMRIYKEESIIERLWEQGAKLAEGLRQVIGRHNIADNFQVFGKPCALVYATRDEQGEPSQSFRALFLQETLRRGLLLPSLVISVAHTDEDIERTVEGIDGALSIYKRALADGVERYLVGRPTNSVYVRYNPRPTLAQDDSCALSASDSNEIHR